MRVSSYEMTYPLIGANDREIEGKTLLVNGLYCAVDVVDAEVGEKMRAGDVAGIPFAVRERLAARGHITRKDEAGELADVRLFGRIHAKILGSSGIGPVLLPTYNCNFRCPYCFERHRLTRGEEWLGSTMTPKMVEAVFAGLQNYKDRGYQVDGVSLYGGEPLMKENMATVRDICEHAKAMELPISAITNGYDLDAYIDLLEEFEVRQLQITVDGVGAMNDCRRLHRDGVPTYDRIMKHVVLALDHGVDVSLRVNVNGENIGSLKELMEDIKARGLAETPRKERMARRKKEKKDGKKEKRGKGTFSYYFKAVTEAKDSPTHVTERNVLDAILAAGVPPLEAIEKQSQYAGPANGLRDVIAQNGFTRPSTAFCGSEQGMAVIAPDGKIYSCWDLVAMDDEAVGIVDEESGRILFGFERAKWRTRTSDLMEPCRTCPLVFFCRGGCAGHARIEHGSCFREHCGEAKEVVAYVAPRVVGEKWEETREANLSVSLLPALSRLTEAERETIMTTRDRTEIVKILVDAGIVFGEQEETKETQD